MRLLLSVAFMGVQGNDHQFRNSGHQKEKANFKGKAFPLPSPSLPREAVPISLTLITVNRGRCGRRLPGGRLSRMTDRCQFPQWLILCAVEGAGHGEIRGALASRPHPEVPTGPSLTSVFSALPSHVCKVGESGRPITCLLLWIKPFTTPLLSCGSSTVLRPNFTTSTAGDAESNSSPWAFPDQVRLARPHLIPDLKDYQTTAIFP